MPHIWRATASCGVGGKGRLSFQCSGTPTLSCSRIKNFSKLVSVWPRSSINMQPYPHVCLSKMIPEVTLHWVRWPSTIRINGDLSLHRWTQYAVYSINRIIVAGVPARALDLTKTKTRADRKALRGEPILFSGFHNNTRPAHSSFFTTQQLSSWQQIKLTLPSSCASIFLKL